MINYLWKGEEKKSLCPKPVTRHFEINDLSDWEDYNTPFNVVKKKVNARVAGTQQFILYYDNSKNDFNSWQHIDVFVYCPKGVTGVIPPPPHWTHVGHLNGVIVCGTINIDDNVNDLLEKDGDNFVHANTLIDIADVYGFDGWYFNVTDECNVETCVLLREFLKYIKDNSEVAVLWNNTMTMDGTNKHENELCIHNSSYLIDKEGCDDVTTLMTLGCDWTSEMVDTVIKYSDGLNILRFRVCFTVDVSLDNYIEKIKLLVGKGVSIGLVNSDCSDKFFKLIEQYVILGTSITSLPFVTNFNVGQGEKYFINGSIVCSNKWVDKRQRDIMPTWRKNVVKNGENYVCVDVCYDDAYIGGSCMRFNGLIKMGESVEIDLFKTYLNMDEGTKIVHIFTKRIANFIKASIKIYFDNKFVNLTLSDDVLYNVWTINKFRMLYNSNVINKISILFENIDMNDIPFTLLLGGVSIFEETVVLPSTPTNLKMINVETTKHNEKSKKHFIKNKLKFNLSWDYDENNCYYYIFRCVILEHTNKVEFIGKTTNNIFHVDNLVRYEGELYSIISVKSVGHNGTVCAKENILQV